MQFCANTVENFVSAALQVEKYCDGVDLNLGCPQHIARRGKYGGYDGNVFLMPVILYKYILDE